MPGRNAPLDEYRVIRDLMRRAGVHMGALDVQLPVPAKDSWTVAATPATTYTLSYLPIQPSINLSLNGVELLEGTDYTVAYTTGVITVSATLKGTPTPADVLSADYWTTGDLIAAGTTPDAGTHLLSDSFTRPDSSTSLGVADSGQTWANVVGTFGIASDAAKAFVVSGGTAIALAGAGGADGMFQADITTTSGATIDAGLVLRSTATATSFIYAQINTFASADRLAVVLCRSGVDSVVTTAGITIVHGSTHHLEVNASGTAITVAFDGVPTLSYTITGSDVALFDANTYAGFRVSTSDTGSTFDNISYST